MNNPAVKTIVINSRGVGHYRKFFLTALYSSKDLQSYVSGSLSVQLKKGRWSSLEILDVVQFSSNELNKLPLVKTKQYTVILLS